MKAVILAAGLGSRLRPITNEVPKCMVPVNGIRIIDKQIDNLLQNGVTEIYVVDGYKAEILADHLKEIYPQVHIVSNPRYAETNNMYSLYLTAKYVKGEEFLLMNSDVYYDTNIIEGMLEGENQSKIACDRSGYMEESMKVVVREGRVEAISKAIPEADAYGCSIDVYKFGSEGAAAFYKRCREYIEEKKDLKKWSEVALNDALKDEVFKVCPLHGRWFEIDDHNDLAAAEALFG